VHRSKDEHPLFLLHVKRGFAMIESTEGSYATMVYGIINKLESQGTNFPCALPLSEPYDDGQGCRVGGYGSSLVINTLSFELSTCRSIHLHGLLTHPCL
jgi:hypothetical protein